MYSQKNVTLFSPGDIYITGISSMEYLETGEKDYGIEFALCEEIRGYILHIKSIVPALEKELEECKGQVYGEGKYRHCFVRFKPAPFRAGSILGTVSDDRQTNFDLGMYDLSQAKTVANPKRYGLGGGKSTLSIVCGLDFYEEEIKKELYEKLRREEEPICGKVVYDIIETLQGNWFYEAADETDWNNHLTFAFDNHDPALAVISIGGILHNQKNNFYSPKQKEEKIDCSQI